MKAPPLLLALVGEPGSGRRTIAQHLKRRHGFAKTSFAQTLREGVQYLYGVAPGELLFDESASIERLGKPPLELMAGLRAHAFEVAGDGFLIRRLVGRTQGRGGWMNESGVISG